MKVIYLLFLLAFLAVLGIFAYYNRGETTVQFLEWSWTAPLALIAGAIYLLGMLSGGTLFGLLKRSANVMVDTLDRRAVS